MPKTNDVAAVKEKVCGAVYVVSVTPVNGAEVQGDYQNRFIMKTLLFIGFLYLFSPQKNDLFNFSQLEAKNNTLFWEVENEQKFGQFFVQVKRVHTWVSFKVVNCKGEKGRVSYQIPIQTKAKRTHFRIKYLDLAGKSIYSPEVCHLKPEKK